MDDRLVVKKQYDDDAPNTETVSSMMVFTNAAHWHARPDVDVEYAADPTRENISYVKVTEAGKASAEYLAGGAQKPTGPLRKMDCIDCHSRPAHSMASSAETAVDRAIAAGDISRSLPYIKREAVGALTGEYPNEDAAVGAISSRLAAFYATTPNVAKSDVAGAVSAVQQLYRSNVFPEMHVTWGTYKSQLGHPESSGCFRCHDDEHKTASGKAVRQDCELCHKDQ